MNARKRNIVAMLFAFGGVLALVLGVLKALIKDEPVNGALIVIACMLFVFAIVSRGVGRKPVDRSDLPSD